MNETQACSEIKTENPCDMNDWQDWEPCSVTCGGGVHARARAVVRQPSNTGETCDGSLHELRMCGTQACDEDAKDCVFGDWADWSECLHKQRTTSREIEEDAVGGAPCEGELEKTEACGNDDDVDCAVGLWTDWGACTAVCGGGQKNRQRQIQKHSHGNGQPCPEVTKETTPCNLIECPYQHCDVGDWSSWGACSADCGKGKMTRERYVKGIRMRGGDGCSEPLTEIRDCDASSCGVVDCAWEDWSEWTNCSKPCAGGQHTRHRHIKDSPRNGGQPCDPIDGDEVEPCNTKACATKNATCIDGTWGKWGSWSSCSADCGGGTRTRTRSMGESANSCGEPATGADYETDFCGLDGCEDDVDCAFSDWTQWSDCSGSCDGVKHRSRDIKTYGRGNGGYCDGALAETSACNTPSKTDGCGAEVVDCKMGDWQGWSECPASCGGGQRSNEREIEMAPRNGGTACVDSLKKVEPCNTQACVNPDKVDCKFGDWAEWGACDKCGGQMKRYRSIQRHAAHGGKQCNYTAEEETVACPRKCHEKMYCVWTGWQDWSTCSRTCGVSGKRTRKRYLTLTHEKPNETLVDVTNWTLAEFDGPKIWGDDAFASDRFKALALSFASGGFSVVVAMLGVRAMSSRSPGRASELTTYARVEPVGESFTRMSQVADAEQPLIAEDAA